jgi:hypothetical protein
MSPGQKKRLRRVERRACEEVKAALARGDITLRRADTLLYLPTSEQKLKLERILADKERTAIRCRRAVEILRRHMAAGSKDLLRLRSDLRKGFSCDR